MYITTYKSWDDPPSNHPAPGTIPLVTLDPAPGQVHSRRGRMRLQRFTNGWCLTAGSMDSNGTVDGRNPAPPGMVKTLQIMYIIMIFFSRDNDASSRPNISCHFTLGFLELYFKKRPLRKKDDFLHSQIRRLLI